MELFQLEYGVFAARGMVANEDLQDALIMLGWIERGQELNFHERYFRYWAREDNSDLWYLGPWYFLYPTPSDPGEPFTLAVMSMGMASSKLFDNMLSAMMGEKPKGFAIASRDGESSKAIQFRFFEEYKIRPDSLVEVTVNGLQGTSSFIGRVLNLRRDGLVRVTDGTNIWSLSRRALQNIVGWGQEPIDPYEDRLGFRPGDFVTFSITVGEVTEELQGEIKAVQGRMLRCAVQGAYPEMDLEVPITSVKEVITRRKWYRQLITKRLLSAFDGDRERVKAWFNTPMEQHGNKTPNQLFRSRKRDYLWDLDYDASLLAGLVESGKAGAEVG